MASSSPSSSSSSTGVLGVLSRDFDFDSLPYIDGEQDLSIAHQLIAEEMRKFKSRDYLKDHPAPVLRFQNSKALQAEYHRVQSGGAMEKMDMSRYEVQPPAAPALTKDVQAWRKCVDNAKSQVIFRVLFTSSFRLV